MALRTVLCSAVLVLALAGCAMGPQDAGVAARGDERLEKRRPSSGFDVYIEGMACPFCTYNVEKKIREIPGVESVTTSLETGIAHVELAEGAAVEPRRVWKQVEKSGFTPTKIVTPRETYHGP
jgi:copper chaperone CopZ